MKINSVLATKGKGVISIGQHRSIKDAVALLSKHNIGALVVTGDAGGLLGILSERDIVRKAAEIEDILSQSVSRVMTRNVITSRPHDDLESVANTMTKKAIPPSSGGIPRRTGWYDIHRRRGESTA